MNYSSLSPVLQVVLITMLALIECAPARIGLRRLKAKNPFALNEPPKELPSLEIKVVHETLVRLFTATTAVATHGYSSKLHLNTE